MSAETTLGPVELADALRKMAKTIRSPTLSKFEAIAGASIMEAAADALITKSADDAMAKHVPPEPAPTLDELSLRVTLAAERQADALEAIMHHGIHVTVHH